MKRWLTSIAALGFASTALAASPPAPLVFPPGAEATEARIAAEIGPLMRAWARSEAGYSSRVSQIAEDLRRAFPNVQPGIQSDAVTLLVLMEKVRIEQSAIVKLHSMGRLDADQQAQLQQAQTQHDQAEAMISNVLKSLDETADAVVKNIKP
jgi:hypothetical protein